MFKQLECEIFHRKYKIRKVNIENNLYTLQNKHIINVIIRINIYKLYKQFSYISYNYIKYLLQQNTLILIYQIIDFKEKQCVNCIKANIKQNLLLK